jgi:Family of unknown function (DUF5519)
MPQPDAAEQITATVTSWPEVESRPHRFGGIEFRLGRRELGHLHGSRVADLPFPHPIHDELIATGRAEPHHILPDSGWVTFRIQRAVDVEHAIELFRLSYEHARRVRRSPDDVGRSGV